MTLPRLAEMTAYWKHSPPVHLMVAAYLGIEDKKEETANDFGDLFATGQQSEVSLYSE